MCDVAVTEVQRKIHNLCSQLLNNMKNIRNKEKSGAGMEEVKKWKFFDEMQFMAPSSAKMLQSQLSATFHRNQLVHSCRFKFYSEKITVSNLFLWKISLIMEQLRAN